MAPNKITSSIPLTDMACYVNAVDPVKAPNSQTQDDALNLVFL